MTACYLLHVKFLQIVCNNAFMCSWLLGRLLRVLRVYTSVSNLVKIDEEMRPNKVSLRCPYIRPFTKRLFSFNEIWYVGRGRTVMHDGMQYDPIQSQGHKPLIGKKFSHFWGLSPPPFIMETGNWPRVLKLGHNTYSLSGLDFWFLS